MSPGPPELRTILVTGQPGLRTTPRGEKERADRYLGRQYDHLSRTRVEALIEEGLVLVDGRHPKPSQAVRPGQRIELTIPALVAPSAEPQDIPLQIVYEDHELIVVDKPAGMVVHPAPGHPSGTLVNALLHHCGDLSGIGGVLRPGIVHRLDKDTSGLLVAAKSQRAHMALSDALKARRIERTYLCVAWGELDPTEGSIDAWIGRSRSNRKRMAAYVGGSEPLTRRWGRPGDEGLDAASSAATESSRFADAALMTAPDSENGREVIAGPVARSEGEGPARPPGVPGHARHALTRYRTLESFGSTSLLECRLATGRTHQIRVHLASTGHSVLADPLYGGGRKALKGLLPARREEGGRLLDLMLRQALHASSLRFEHPVRGGALSFSSPLPGDFHALLELLRSL